jgi:hypothetical protein
LSITFLYFCNTIWLINISGNNQKIFQAPNPKKQPLNTPKKPIKNKPQQKIPINKEDLVVGRTGFGPATFCTSSRCPNQARRPAHTIACQTCLFEIFMGFVVVMFMFEEEFPFLEYVGI